MANLNQIVDVIITRETKGVTQKGFGVPLILGLHTRFAERVRFYEELDGVAADFQTSDAEYKAAAAIFAQEQRPEKVAIGRRTAVVAQVVTYTPTVQNNTLYTVTINGVVFSYTSDADATAGEIVAGLIAAINAGSEPVTASGTTTLILTADVAGTAFTYAATANLAGVLTVPNNGVVEDLQAVINESDDWYCLLLTSRVQADIMNAAANIETRKKIFIACVEESGVLAVSSTDTAALLQAKNYDRTALLYSEDQENYPEAAWAGLVLPFDPGSETWKFKNLSGIVADVLTSTEQTNAKGKNANTYEEIAGVAITAEGKMASGEFIDTIRFIDWMEARLQERIYAKLINLPKVPFTDAGIAIIETEIRAQVEDGIKAGGLASDPAPTYDIPKAASVSLANKQARLLPDMKFVATLAGAIHKVQIRGRVTL